MTSSAAPSWAETRRAASRASREASEKSTHATTFLKAAVCLSRTRSTRVDTLRTHWVARMPVPRSGETPCEPRTSRSALRSRTRLMISVNGLLMAIAKSMFALPGTSLANFCQVSRASVIRPSCTSWMYGFIASWSSMTTRVSMTWTTWSLAWFHCAIRAAWGRALAELGVKSTATTIEFRRSISGSWRTRDRRMLFERRGSAALATGGQHGPQPENQESSGCRELLIDVGDQVAKGDLSCGFRGRKRRVDPHVNVPRCDALVRIARAVVGRLVPHAVVPDELREKPSGEVGRVGIDEGVDAQGRAVHIVDDLLHGKRVEPDGLGGHRGIGRGGNWLERGDGGDDGNGLDEGGDPRPVAGGVLVIDREVAGADRVGAHAAGKLGEEGEDVVAAVLPVAADPAERVLGRVRAEAPDHFVGRRPIARDHDVVGVVGPGHANNIMITGY